MADIPAGRMPVSDRAKQFMPFSALRGLNEALSRKERIIVERPILSEDRLSELDTMIRRLSSGMIVTVIYYSDGSYIQITGMFAGIDEHNRLLRVVNTRIAFDDIVDVTIQE